MTRRLKRVTDEQGSGIHYGAVLIGEDINGEQLWANLEVDEVRLVLFLRAKAHQALPPATRFEVRKALSGHFGRSHQMAWYRVRTMDAIADWADGGTGEVEATLVPEGGYCLVGRFTTPSKGQMTTPGVKH